MNRPLLFHSRLATALLVGCLIIACSRSNDDSSRDDPSSSDGGSPGDGDSDPNLGGMGGGDTGGGGNRSGGESGTGASDGTGGATETGGTAGAPSLDDLPEEIQAHCERMETYACDMFKSCQGWTNCDQHPLTALRDYCQETLPLLWAEERYTFDADLAESCLPEQIVCPGRWADLFDTYSCRDVFQGTIPLGGDCNSEGWIFGSTCAEGHCVYDGQSCPGKCQAYAEEGESCTTIPCAPGARCVEGLCVQPPEWNEPCTETCVGSLICSDVVGDKVCHSQGIAGDPCAASLPCMSSSMCQEGVCVDSVALGAACNSTAVCPSGATCFSLTEGATSTCNEIKPLGAECESTIECGAGDVECVDADPSDADPQTTCTARSGTGGPCEPAGCGNGLWCQYPPSGATEEGICRLPGGLGDSCETAEGPRSNANYPCLWTSETRLFCVEGECRDQPQLGDPCNPEDRSWDICQDSWCSFATRECMAPGSEGAPCNLDAQLTACDSDSYCMCEDDSCDNASDSGVCAPRKPNTALCGSSEECLSAYCGAERCEDAPLVCTSQ